MTHEQRADRPRSPRRSGPVTIGAMLVVVVADFASKAAAHVWAPPHTQVDIGLLGVVRPLWNPDFSLGLGGASHGQAVLLAALVAAAGIALAVKLPWRGQVPLMAMAVGAGGAVANLVDRALHGAVADFLVIGPVVVNVADLAVAAAVLTLWLRALRIRGTRTLPS